MRELKVLEKESVVKDHYDKYLGENNAEVLGLPPNDIVIESCFHENQRYNKISYIGSFEVYYDDLDESLIVNQIKSGKKILNYSIYVYDKEGPTPHFHITSNDGGREFDGCVCIFEPKFFDHGKHTGILNKKELKILDSFLRSSTIWGESYWKFIVSEWYRLNPDNFKNYPQNRKTNVQPNYVNTNSTITESIY